ncbi:caspase family protein [Serratia marcescens]|uniref:caspase family protein n=1 Tax=Serratia marcescens TaxID=615 RepID=UPI0013DCECD9|nr:caspase family protein [Serratia marcescens]
MKLAIVIGVSNYILQPELSASKNDARLIKSVLNLSEEYTDILYIENETNTRQVKSKLSEFIAEHSEKEVDELLFYFSGHGLFDGSDFHYIMSDFDARKIKSTSLENSELDIMMKSLNPKLTVKIVDACNSGVSYIKDPTALSKHIDESKLGFSKCYFMFSSEDAQYSFADAHLSFFTKAIGEAVAYSADNSIRYKDIIDYISDKFSRNEHQSPVFINQASFTEVFIKTITQENKNAIEKALSVIPDSITEAKKHPLKELVERDAARYFTEDKAVKIYESIPELVKKEFKFKLESKDLFNLKIENLNSYDEVPKLSLLSEWVDKNNDDLFVKAIKETKERKVRKPKKRMTALEHLNVKVWGIDDDDNYTWTTEYYMSPTHIESSLDCSFKVISILAKSKYPNINSTKLYILPFLSKTRLVILSCIALYKPSGWENETRVDSNVKWTPYNIELASEGNLVNYLRTLAENFESETLTPVLKSFNLLSDKSGDQK